MAGVVFVKVRTVTSDASVVFVGGGVTVLFPGCATDAVFPGWGLDPIDAAVFGVGVDPVVAAGCFEAADAGVVTEVVGAGAAFAA